MKIQSLYFLLLMFLFPLFSLPTMATDQASSLNSEGMKFYKKKRYDEARTFFEKAVKANPRHKKAPFNLACTYSLLDKLYHRGCESGEDFLQLTFDQLKAAYQHNPMAYKKAMKDSDFKHLYNLFSFRVATGQITARTATIRDIAQNGQWILGDCSGLYPNCSKIMVQSNGDLTGTRIAPCFGDDCTDITKVTTIKGRAESKNGVLILIFPDGTKEEYPLPRYYGDNSTKLKDREKANCDA